MSLEGFYNTICPGSKKKISHKFLSFVEGGRTVIFLLRAGGGGVRSWLCHDNFLPDPRIRLSNNLITPSSLPFPLPPPLLAVNRQSVFHSSRFILCRRPLIPPPFPLKTMRPPGEKVFYPTPPQPPRR